MSEKVFAIVLLIGVAATAAINAFKPTIPTVQTRQEVTTTTSTEAKPQDVAVVSVPSFETPEPQISISPPELKTDAVALQFTPQPSPRSWMAATATGRTYQQPVYQMPRRRLFGRIRR